jgi:hypothetical protein
MRWPWSRRRAAAVAQREHEHEHDHEVPYVIIGGRKLAVDSPYILPKDVTETETPPHACGRF